MKLIKFPILFLSSMVVILSTFLFCQYLSEKSFELKVNSIRNWADQHLDYGYDLRVSDQSIQLRGRWNSDINNSSSLENINFEDIAKQDWNASRLTKWNEDNSGSVSFYSLKIGREMQLAWHQNTGTETPSQTQVAIGLPDLSGEF